MANPKGSTTARNFMKNGKSYLLPPKSPFPSITPFHSDYGPNSYFGSKTTSKGRDVNSFHQRTSSESLIEEQPSWLDELLNEPETPMRKGHRRSSSDSFAYYDAINMSSIECLSMVDDESKFRTKVSSPLWGSQNLDLSKESHQGSQSINNNTYGKFTNRALEKSGPSRASKDSIEGDLIASKIVEKQDQSEFGPHDSKTLAEKKDGLNAKTPSENDTKRAKQQFAQRSRVRKLQYIAELERNVHAFQAEGSEVSAELEFLNQQNVILSMENKALKQRLESLAQEKLIKHLEHEVLEREISRLRSLYQQQQQPLQQQVPHQRPSSSHRRTNSRDLDSQFSNLNLKQKEAGSRKDSFFSGVVGV